MREIVTTTKMHKPFIALIDPDASRGGLSIAEVQSQLIEAEGNYVKWGFDMDTTPLGAAVFDHLFKDDAIEWNRIVCD